MAVYRNEVPLDFDRGALSRGVQTGAALGESFVRGQERRQARGDELEARGELDAIYEKDEQPSGFEQESQAQQEIQQILQQEKDHIQARRQGLTVLSDLKDLTGQSPAMRKANAPIMFAEYERQFGRPLAQNVKDMVLKAPSEEVKPVINGLISEYSNSEATSRQVVSTLSNPGEAAKKLGQLNRSSMTQDGISAPPPAQRTDPRQKQLKRLQQREQKLTQVATKYANTKSGQSALQAAQRVQKDIDQLEASIKGERTGPFETFIMPDGQTMEVRRDSEQANMIASIPGVKRKSGRNSEAKYTFSDMKKDVIARIAADQYPKSPEGKEAKRRDQEMYDLIINADPLEKLMRNMMNPQAGQKPDPFDLRK